MIAISDSLLSQARRVAAETGRTLTSVIEEAVRESLARRRKEMAPATVRLTTFRGSGLQPDFDFDDTSALLDLMDGPHAPDAG